MSTQDDKTKYSSLSTEELENLFESMDSSNSSPGEITAVVEEMGKRNQSKNEENCETITNKATNFKTLTTPKLREIYQQNNRYIRTNSEFSQIAKVLQDRNVNFQLWDADRESLNGDAGAEENFWAFDKLITIPLLQFLHVIGILAIVGFSVYLIKEGITGWGVLLMIFGNIIWRVVCEALAIPFKIYERLCRIEKKQ